MSEAGPFVVLVQILRRQITYASDAATCTSASPTAPWWHGWWVSGSLIARKSIEPARISRYIVSIRCARVTPAPLLQYCDAGAHLFSWKNVRCSLACSHVPMVDSCVLCQLRVCHACASGLILNRTCSTQCMFKRMIEQDSSAAPQLRVYPSLSEVAPCTCRLMSCLHQSLFCACHKPSGCGISGSNIHTECMDH
jgi:hypothetical protein